MRPKNKFNRNENQFYENQIRSYPDLKREIAVAKLCKNETAFEYYSKLKSDIEETMRRLPDNLQELIEDYFWGENRHIRDWETIGEQCLMSKRNGYAARVQIIEEFAKVRGILIQ